jgi:hypothetical protein
VAAGRQETRSSAELVGAALCAINEDVRWELVAELHRRGTREELELALGLFEQGEAEQVLACDLLGQLGATRREHGAYPFGADSSALLARGLRSASPLVQRAAVTALGHLKWEPLFESLSALAASPDEQVRHAVAFALGGRTDDASVDTLIALSEDRDDDVRNWATFGLGSLSERRDARVCDALARRLHDPHDETRGEAWVGLAQKGDMRAFEPVRAQLDSDELDVLTIEAAECYAHPAFVPALERWRAMCEGDEDPYLRGLLDGALAACRVSQD